MSKLIVISGKTGVFPHKKYLSYLISKKLTSFEITALCTDKGILPPTADDIQAVAADLGPFPPSWQGSLAKAKPQFRNWLSRKGIMTAWRSTDEFSEASSFLYKASARKDFEALYLIRGDVTQAREELLVKYPAGFIPSIDSLKVFVEYYWDLGSLKYNEIVEFLAASQDREDLLPAVEGDLSTAYARLGLRQKIEEEEFYDNLIALANQQIQSLRKSGDLNGSMLLGISALSRQAADAIQNRKELHASTAPTVDAIRQKAADFFRVRMAHQAEIISIEEIQEESQELDNVRKLEIRR